MWQGLCVRARVTLPLLTQAAGFRSYVSRNGGWPRGCAAAACLFFGECVAFRDQGVELRLLLGDAVGVAFFILGAGIASCLFDKLAKVVANDLDTLFELGKVFGIGHGRSCSFSSSARLPDRLFALV
jgi:hypothetical protein